VTAVDVAELLVSTTLAVTTYHPSGTTTLVTWVGMDPRETGVVDKPNWAVNPDEGP
jgi:hypothetical protein